MGLCRSRKSITVGSAGAGGAVTIYGNVVIGETGWKPRIMAPNRSSKPLSLDFEPKLRNWKRTIPDAEWRLHASRRYRQVAG